MKAPIRLLDDPELSGELRADLERAAEAEPHYDSERGLRGLHAAIASIGHTAPLAEPGSMAGQAGASAAQSGVGAAAAKGALAASLASTKAAVIGVATAVSLAGAGAGAWAYTQRSLAPTVSQSEHVRAATTTRAGVASPTPRAQPTGAAEPAIAAEASATADAAGVPSDARPTPHVSSGSHGDLAATDRGSHAPLAATVRAGTRSAAVSTADGDDALRREIAHLARVKALLAHDPRAAYELAQEGNRAQSSMLQHERDGLSVLALHAAGDIARAQKLAVSFLARYPRSPLRERIAVLAQDGAP